MTTPRDAIGLSERLRATKQRWAHPYPSYGDLKLHSAIEEAAAALDALQARVKELERESDGYKRLYNDEVVERLRAEKQRDAAEARATSAEQERDEAYERAAQCAEGPIYKEIYRGGPGHNWHHIKQPGHVNDYGNGRLDAAAAIRRLAAGTEKEKRE